MSASKPKIREVLERALGQLEVKIRTVIAANVVSFDAARQVATVQPAPRKRNEANELVPMAPIVDAPILYPGGGGWSISWPLLPLDQVVLFVHDRNLDGFRLTGTAYDPLSVRLHDVTDAIVFPGAMPAPDPVTGLSAVDLTISGPGGIAITVSPAGIVSLGGIIGAGAPVALADALHTYLSGLFASGLPVPKDGGAALQTAWSTYLATNPFAAFAATRVVAQ